MGRRRERRQEKSESEAAVEQRARRQVNKDQRCERLRDCRTCSMCGTSNTPDGVQSHASRYMRRFIPPSQRWGWCASDYPDLTFGSCDKCQGQYCANCTVYTDHDLMGTSGSWCVCSLCYKTHATYRGKATYVIHGAEGEWQLV